MTYWAIIDGGGAALGFVDDTLDTPPSGAVQLTNDQWTAWAANPPGFTWSGGTLQANSAGGGTPPATGYSTLTNGITINSTGTPAINGTYPADPTTLAQLNLIWTYVNLASVFPGGASSLTLLTIGGTKKVFSSTTLFVNFMKALTDAATKCQQVDIGASGATLPGTATIP